MKRKDEEKKEGVDRPDAFDGVTRGDEKDSQPDRVENGKKIQTNTNDNHRSDVTDLNILSLLSSFFFLLYFETKAIEEEVRGVFDQMKKSSVCLLIVDDLEFVAVRSFPGERFEEKRITILQQTNVEMNGQELTTMTLTISTDGIEGQDNTQQDVQLNKASNTVSLSLSLLLLLTPIDR